jgi:histone deacetylase 1/2
MTQTNPCPSEKSPSATSALDAPHPVAISLALLYPARPPATTASTLGTAAPLSPLVASPPTSVPSQVYSPLSAAQTETSSKNLIVSHSPVVPLPIEPRPHRMVTRSMNNICKPKSLFMVTKHPLPPSLEPTSVTQAFNEPHWRAAMSSELTALMRHDTWHLVPPLNDYNIIGCMWVFRVKRFADGSIDRFKARVVAKGFN